MKIEMHFHTKNGSSDSNLGPQESIKKLISCGYGGVVTTDHYDDYEIKWHTKSSGITKINMKEANELWLRGYRSMRVTADGDFKVFLGMEFSIQEFEHVLIYGLTEDIVVNNFRPNLGVSGLVELALRFNLLLIQAHPYRYSDNDKLHDRNLNGYEVWNSKDEVPRNDCNNKIIEYLMEHNNETSHMVRIGGGDCHEIEHIGKSGVDFNKSISENKELVKELLAGNYSIIRN